MTGDDAGSGTRMTTLDRKWSRGHSVMLLTATRARPAAQVRALLEDFIGQYPSHPLACRIDRRRNRWIPVDAAERQAHAARLVVTTDQPDPDHPERYLHEQVAALTPEMPFRAAVSEHAVFAIMSHAVGDAVTLGVLAIAVLLPDVTPAHDAVARLAAIEPRVRRSLAVRELLRGLPRHHRDWLAHIPHRARRRPARTPARPDGHHPRPALTSMIIPNEQVRALPRWRNRNSPGTGITAVLTSATYRALVSNGVDIDGHAYYAMFDLRRFLPATTNIRCGNLAKSLYLNAELDDPCSIDEALRQANESRRVVPAIALQSAMRRRQRPETAGNRSAKPLTLTFTIMPAFAGLSDLTPTAPHARRLYAFGTPTAPGGIAISVVRLREHMQVFASFDESTVPLATVNCALKSLTDPCALMALRL